MINLSNLPRSLEEVLKFVTPIKDNQSIKDETITGILQYFDLIDELKNNQ